MQCTTKYIYLGAVYPRRTIYTMHLNDFDDMKTLRAGTVPLTLSSISNYPLLNYYSSRLQGHLTAWQDVQCETVVCPRWSHNFKNLILLLNETHHRIEEERSLLISIAKFFATLSANTQTCHSNCLRG